MRMPEQYVVGCPTEEEMDKELELLLVEQYGLWELARKIYQKWFENWKKEGYDEWYDKWYDEWHEDWRRFS